MSSAWSALPALIRRAMAVVTGVVEHGQLLVLGFLPSCFLAYVAARSYAVGHQTALRHEFLRVFGHRWQTEVCDLSCVRADVQQDRRPNRALSYHVGKRPFKVFEPVHGYSLSRMPNAFAAVPSCSAASGAAGKPPCVRNATRRMPGTS